MLQKRLISTLTEQIDLKSGFDSWEGSFDQTLRDCKSSDIDDKDLEALINSLHYIPVFTAHPTEAKEKK